MRVLTGISVLRPIHVTALCSYPVNFADISSGASLTVLAKLLPTFSSHNSMTFTLTKKKEVHQKKQLFYSSLLKEKREKEMEIIW